MVAKSLKQEAMEKLYSEIYEIGCTVMKINLGDEEQTFYHLEVSQEKTGLLCGLLKLPNVNKFIAQDAKAMRFFVEGMAYEIEKQQDLNDILEIMQYDDLVMDYVTLQPADLELFTQYAQERIDSIAAHKKKKTKKVKKKM